MPDDMNGRPIRPGDIVNIPCLVTGVDSHGEYINLAVETLEGRTPDGKKASFFINTHQVEVMMYTGHSDPEIDVEKALSDSGAHDFSEKPR